MLCLSWVFTTCLLVSSLPPAGVRLAPAGSGPGTGPWASAQHPSRSLPHRRACWAQGQPGREPGFRSTSPSRGWQRGPDLGRLAGTLSLWHVLAAGPPGVDRDPQTALRPGTCWCRPCFPASTCSLEGHGGPGLRPVHPGGPGRSPNLWKSRWTREFPGRHQRGQPLHGGHRVGPEANPDGEPRCPQCETVRVHWTRAWGCFSAPPPTEEVVTGGT